MKNDVSNEQPNDWDPQDPSILKDQRRAYDEMREKCPVAHSKFMGWSVFCHQDIVNVLADPETYSNQSQFLAIPNGMDPPVHAQYRKALTSFFDNQAMAMFEPSVRKTAIDLLSTLRFNQEIEFVNVFITPFIMKTLCHFLGWPEEQWKDLNGWVHDNQEVAFSRDPAVGKALAQSFSKYVKTNLAQHRTSSNKTIDVTDRLLQVEVNDTPLSDEQIVSVLRNWAAGHGTVAAGLSILMFHLAKDTKLQIKLRNNLSYLPQAIEEILRMDGPLVANRRVTTREVKIQGRTIPKGENLSLMWIAANRDPQVFEEPNNAQLDRDTKEQLLFGQGIHFCLGAPLARLEMRIALEVLLSQTNSIELIGVNQHRAIYPSNGFATLFLKLNKK